MKKVPQAVAFLAGVIILAGCQKEIVSEKNQTLPDDPGQLKKSLAWQGSTYATGLVSPIGMAIDPQGKLWVSEAGTGNNDGRVSVVTADGTVHPAIVGFPGIINPQENLPAGNNHLAIRGQMLYILNGVAGNLYMADISGWKPGDAPMQAANLTSQNISTYVLSQDLANPPNSNIYNLCFGPDGDLFMTDAGANAIIRRNSETGALSVFAKFPNLAPDVEPVPTGIVYTGSQFLVSTLGGFPFVEGLSKIFAVSKMGDVSVYKDGLTTLTDIELTPDRQILALQFASFVFNPPTNVGFAPFTGRISDGDGNTLMGGLMMPTSLVCGNGGNHYFVLSLALGRIMKIE
jgi:hypothetical protein